MSAHPLGSGAPERIFAQGVVPSSAGCNDAAALADAQNNNNNNNVASSSLHLQRPQMRQRRSATAGPAGAEAGSRANSISTGGGYGPVGSGTLSASGTAACLASSAAAAAAAATAASSSALTTRGPPVEVPADPLARSVLLRAARMLFLSLVTHVAVIEADLESPAFWDLSRQQTQSLLDPECALPTRIAHAQTAASISFDALFAPHMFAFPSAAATAASGAGGLHSYVSPLSSDSRAGASAGGGGDGSSSSGAASPAARSLPIGLELFAFPGGCHLAGARAPRSVHGCALTGLDGTRSYCYVLTTHAALPPSLLATVRAQVGSFMLVNSDIDLDMTGFTLPAAVYASQALVLVARRPLHRFFEGFLEALAHAFIPPALVTACGASSCGSAGSYTASAAALAANSCSQSTAATSTTGTGTGVGAGAGTGTGASLGVGGAPGVMPCTASEANSLLNGVCASAATAAAVAGASSNCSVPAYDDDDETAAAAPDGALRPWGSSAGRFADSKVFEPTMDPDAAVARRNSKSTLQGATADSSSSGGGSGSGSGSGSGTVSGCGLAPHVAVCTAAGVSPEAIAAATEQCQSESQAQRQPQSQTANTAKDHDKKQATGRDAGGIATAPLCRCLATAGVASWGAQLASLPGSLPPSLPPLALPLLACICLGAILNPVTSSAATAASAAAAAASAAPQRAARLKPSHRHSVSPAPSRLISSASELTPSSPTALAAAAAAAVAAASSASSSSAAAAVSVPSPFAPPSTIWLPFVHPLPFLPCAPVPLCAVSSAAAKAFASASASTLTSEPARRQSYLLTMRDTGKNTSGSGNSSDKHRLHPYVRTITPAWLARLTAALNAALAPPAPLPSPDAPAPQSLTAVTPAAAASCALGPAGAPRVDADFSHLLRRVEPDVLSLVIDALLQETPLLVTASAPRPLLHVCESLLALLAPLTHSLVYIPLLPVCLADFLHAPQPFVIGGLTALRDCAPAHVMVLDLDSSSVRLPTAARDPPSPAPVPGASASTPLAYPSVSTQLAAPQCQFRPLLPESLHARLQAAATEAEAVRGQLADFAIATARRQRARDAAAAAAATAAASANTYAAAASLPASSASATALDDEVSLPGRTATAAAGLRARSESALIVMASRGSQLLSRVAPLDAVTDDEAATVAAAAAAAAAASGKSASKTGGGGGNDTGAVAAGVADPALRGALERYRRALLEADAADAVETAKRSHGGHTGGDEEKISQSSSSSSSSSSSALALAARVMMRSIDGPEFAATVAVEVVATPAAALMDLTVLRLRERCLDAFVSLLRGYRFFLRPVPAHVLQRRAMKQAAAASFAATSSARKGGSAAPAEEESLASLSASMFRREEFLDESPPETRPALEALFGTQMFVEFLTDRARRAALAAGPDWFDARVTTVLRRAVERLADDEAAAATSPVFVLVKSFFSAKWEMGTLELSGNVLRWAVRKPTPGSATGTPAAPASTSSSAFSASAGAISAKQPCTISRVAAALTGGSTAAAAAEAAALEADAAEIAALTGTVVRDLDADAAAATAYDDAAVKRSSSDSSNASSAHGAVEPPSPSVSRSAIKAQAALRLREQHTSLSLVESDDSTAANGGGLGAGGADGAAGGAGGHFVKSGAGGALGAANGPDAAALAAAVARARQRLRKSSMPTPFPLLVVVAGGLPASAAAAAQSSAAAAAGEPQDEGEMLVFFRDAPTRRRFVQLITARTWRHNRLLFEAFLLDEDVRAQLETEARAKLAAQSASAAGVSGGLLSPRRRIGVPIGGESSGMGGGLRSAVSAITTTAAARGAGHRAFGGGSPTVGAARRLAPRNHRSSLAGPGSLPNADLGARGPLQRHSVLQLMPLPAPSSLPRAGTEAIPTSFGSAGAAVASASGSPRKLLPPPLPLSATSPSVAETIAAAAAAGAAAAAALAAEAEAEADARALARSAATATGAAATGSGATLVNSSSGVGSTLSVSVDDVHAGDVAAEDEDEDDSDGNGGDGLGDDADADAEDDVIEADVVAAMEAAGQQHILDFIGTEDAHTAPAGECEQTGQLLTAGIQAHLTGATAPGAHRRSVLGSPLALASPAEIAATKRRSFFGTMRAHGMGEAVARSGSGSSGGSGGDSPGEDGAAPFGFVALDSTAADISGVEAGDAASPRLAQSVARRLSIGMAPAGWGPVSATLAPVSDADERDEDDDGSEE